MELFLMIIASFLFCSLNEVATQVTATISPDLDYNAPLDVNTMVRFNCTGTGPIIDWTVDGASANEPTIQNRGVTTTPSEGIGGGVFFSSLFIRASKENDNTSIQCTTIRIINISPNVFQSGSSELVFLHIQGHLGPPPNLKFSQANENCIGILSWDAPETLDLTDIEPDITYYRICYNVSTTLSCVINEKREFRFSNISVTLLFNVTAANVVGEGNSSSIIYKPNTVHEKDAQATDSLCNGVQCQCSKGESRSNGVSHSNQCQCIIGGIIVAAGLLLCIPFLSL